MNDEQRWIANGCRCRECFGLAETMILSAGKDFGLPRAPRPHDGPRKLRIVTPGPAPKDAKTFEGVVPTEQLCDGSMTCACTRCESQRAALVKRGSKGSAARQPWEAKAA
jgi:hypothetical protein